MRTALRAHLRAAELMLSRFSIEFDVVRGKGPMIPVPIRSMEQVAALRPMEARNAAHMSCFAQLTARAQDPEASLPFIRPILQALRCAQGFCCLTPH